MPEQDVLTSTKLDELVRYCLGNEETGEPFDALVGTVYYNKEKVTEKSEEIFAMLMELPETYRESSGGGWSFLQACDDRYGHQWTGEHRMMAFLFTLGQAAGFVACPLPRALWEALPGGMPYYIVMDKAHNDV